MKTSTDFAIHLSRFLSEYLPHERGMSHNTALAYRDTFMQFIRYMKEKQKIPVEKLTLDKLSKGIVVDFLEWIQNERNCSTSTRNYRLAAIHSFVSYLQYEDIAQLDRWQKILSIKMKKVEQKTINYLTTDAVKLLLEQPDRTTPQGRRNLALLALMYDTGARVQEIINLTPEAVNITSTPYTVRLLGKGKKYRVVPLMEAQILLLKQYMEENHLMETCHLKHPLFFNSRKEKLTRTGVAYILSTYVKMARTINPKIILDSISCHSLRHSKAMHLLQAGVNLVYIRDILGHVSVQTTEVYAKADSQQKREALEKNYLKLIPDTDTTRQWDNNRNLLEWLKNFGK